ncbi:MAG: O-methyltransferase [Bacteroidia bacterium]
MRSDRSPELSHYIESMCLPEPDYLLAVRRQTHLRVLYPQMLSGVWQGRLLAWLSRWLRPQQILEIGTFTGYSALCLAEGLAATGRLTTIERNPELVWLIENHLGLSPYASQIDLLTGDAADLLPTLAGPFDLVFLDADKARYPHYLDLIMPRLATGGLLVADNVLWDGRIADPTLQSREVVGLRTFNAQVRATAHLEPLLLPVRDGLLLARKV